MVIDFQPIFPRLCKIRLRGKFFNYPIINTHAPTEDEEKDTFYHDLEQTWNRSPKRDIKIVM